MTRFLYAGNRRKGPSSWAKPAPGDFGIGIFRFDEKTGAMTETGRAIPEISVGQMCHDTKRRVIYAVDEALTLPGHHLGGGGQVVALSVDPDTGGLTEINRQPSFGTLPSDVALDTSGRFLIATHHTGHTPITRTERAADGSLRIVLDYDEAATVLFPLDPDGRIGAPCDIHRHKGMGALPAQTHPQLHSVTRAPDRDLFIVCDKGADRIHVFGLDPQARRLTSKQTLAAPPGSSPRYCVFHPEHPVFYVNFETAPILRAYGFSETGEVSLLSETAALPPSQSPDPAIMQSDLVLHPSGRFLYSLLRGPETVTVFSVGCDGRPQPIASHPLGVGNARGAAISPDGRHFLVAGVTSHEIRAWTIGPDGLLSGASTSTPQPAPGCLLFV